MRQFVPPRTLLRYIISLAMPENIALLEELELAGVIDLRVNNQFMSWWSRLPPCVDHVVRAMKLAS